MVVSQVDTVVASRLASDLSAAMDDLDILPPREAAANLRKTLLERCKFYRRLITDYSAAGAHDRLKREQMLLVLTRQFRENPTNSPLL
jgi:hypothetical protein